MTPNQLRIQQFTADLEAAFAIANLHIDDESHMHAGHSGAASGGGHFRVTLVAPEFTGLSRVARHRLVYDALQKHIPAEIHALAIVALTPEEAI